MREVKSCRMRCERHLGRVSFGGVYLDRERFADAKQFCTKIPIFAMMHAEMHVYKLLRIE